MRAYAELALQSQLEYRVNAIADWCLNPLMSTIVEIAMWWTMFEAMGVTTLGGFPREYYLAYVTWAVFFARISANWMYEFRMLQEVESGSINAILVRPVSFYEFYLGQFLGYKVFTTLFSLWLPAILALVVGGTTDFARLPMAVLLVWCHLVFIFTLSFCVMTISFRLTKATSFTVTKNFLIWLASGELFPLDLLPKNLQMVASYLPFSSGCYVPVGFLTHRLGWGALWQGFWVNILWIAFFGLLGSVLWRRGLRQYAGTGA
jgi:ABC-2 type transport system permease protein